MRFSSRVQRLAPVLALACFSVATFPAEHASACGVSADGVWSCSLEEHDEELRPRWQLGASGEYTATALRFSSHLRGDETRYAASASALYAPTRRLSFQLSAGAILGGGLDMPDGRHDFAVGPSLALGAAYRLIEGRPFLLLTSVLSGVATRTHLPDGGGESIGYEALDLRLGAIFGTTLFDVLSPYALARAFGGPVFWRYQGLSRTGTDVSHFQLGAGLSLSIAERFSLFVEGVPLGEQALSAGFAGAF